GWRELNRQVHDLVVLPVLEAMARRGHPYRGCLYVGAMVLEGQVQVLEFNARFGDPETEVLLPMIEDPLPILLQAAAGALDSPAPVLRAAAAVGVVAVREPYPGPVDPGGPVLGLAEAGAEGAVIFQMGTRSAPGGAVEVAGGRVLISTATGPDLAHAREAAYQGMKMIRFAGMRFRHDIAA
ncbi:MAG: phosphoribosylglycinamide synthetase C domain-containing protein, partial [Candidatus Dormibacteria bacterium]